MTATEPEDRFGASDGTLADNDDDVVEAAAEARVWLAQQRFVHGLLRALHTADSGARQARVQSLMARLQPARSRWRRLAIAAALLLGAGAVVFALWPDPARMPRAEAMVARAIAALDQPVDREFELVVDLDRWGRHVERRMQITLRPGRRFLVEGDATLGAFRAGCDGETVWLQHSISMFGHAFDVFRTDMPLHETRRLTQRLGDMLDLGYLDLATLLARLPKDAALRCVGREPGGIRVEATGSVRLRHLELRSIQMVVDDRAGMLRAIDATVVGDGRTRVEARLRYRYVGDHDLGESAYQRPW